MTSQEAGQPGHTSSIPEGKGKMGPDTAEETLQRRPKFEAQSDKTFSLASDRPSPGERVRTITDAPPRARGRTTTPHPLLGRGLHFRLDSRIHCPPPCRLRQQRPHKPPPLLQKRPARRPASHPRAGACPVRPEMAWQRVRGAWLRQRTGGLCGGRYMCPCPRADALPRHAHGGPTTTGPDATHPPTICQNSGGGGAGGSSGGVRLGGVGGGFRPWGGFPRWGGLARDPLLPHAYLLGCVCLVCVWGFGGTEVCMR